MAKPVLISIIIVQYNNSADTIKCLDSIRNIDYPSYNIIVVDNASDSKHLKDIKTHIGLLGSDRLALIPSDQNLGYVGGNNLGIKHALEHGADYVLILNPDATTEKTTLTKLVETAESDASLGIVGPVINESGNKTVYGGRIAWLSAELEHNHKPIAIDYISGAAMLIKKVTIQKIGLFDDRYFLYFEDADYCMRARGAGYKLTIATAASINHKVSASTNQLGSALLLRYHYRNAHLFNLKNSPWYIKLSLPFWSVFIIIKQFLKIIFVPKKREISKAILSGVIDFYTNRFGRISV